MSRKIGQTRRYLDRGGSSVGRALRSQCRGRGFDSLPLHFVPQGLATSTKDATGRHTLNSSRNRVDTSTADRSAIGLSIDFMGGPTMARKPSSKPWLHTPSGFWCATIRGKREYLDRDVRVASPKLKATLTQATGGDLTSGEWLDASFATLADEFLADIKVRKKPATYTSYRYRLLRALKVIGKALRVGEVRKLHLAQIERALTPTCSPTTFWMPIRSPGAINHSPRSRQSGSTYFGLESARCRMLARRVILTKPISHRLCDTRRRELGHRFWRSHFRREFLRIGSLGLHE
jgi:hypothetical protein